MEYLKDKDLDKYYQERFITTGTPGWEALMEEVETLLKGYDSLQGANTVEELYFRKGQVDILRWILNTRPLAQASYDDLMQQEQEPNDESL
jgi:hypothetical protein